MERMQARGVSRDLARVDDPPDPAVRIVRDVECAVGSDGDSCGPVRGPTGSHGTGKAIGEDIVLPGGLAVASGWNTTL